MFLQTSIYARSGLLGQLGTAREVVSRQLHEFQKRGWLEQGRGRVRLLQPDALARFAASG